MNKLIVFQADAINLANLTLSSVAQSVILAARTGEALIKVKKSLPHGEYTAWVEANMPLSPRQCQKFVKLAIENPDAISNTNPGAFLDINSELLLLAFDNETKNKIRDIAKENDLNRYEISTLTQQLKTKTREAQEWRQQNIDEKNAACDLKDELKRVKATKVETVYVDDSEKALAQYKEETSGKIAMLKTLTDEAKTRLKDVQDEKSQAITDGVRNTLKNHSDEIERLQKKEMSLQSRIEKLDAEWNELDNSVGIKKDQLTAQKEYKGLIEQLAIKGGILYDNDSDFDDAIEWHKLFDSTDEMTATFRGLVNNTTKAQDLEHTVKIINAPATNKLDQQHGVEATTKPSTIPANAKDEADERPLLKKVRDFETDKLRLGDSNSRSALIKTARLALGFSTVGNLSNIEKQSIFDWLKSQTEEQLIKIVSDARDARKAKNG